MDRLIALTQVDSYVKKDGTRVSGYTRAPGKMSNKDITNELAELHRTAASPQRNNRIEQLNSEKRKRMAGGNWYDNDHYVADNNRERSSLFRRRKG